MKLIILICLSTATLALTPAPPINTARPVQEKSGTIPAKVIRKKSGGIPPYAVSMEPLAKYSQPDPLYSEGKTAVPKGKKLNPKSGHVRVKKDDGNSESIIGYTPRISSKTGFAYEDAGLENTQYHHLGFTGHGGYYDHHHYEEPEPIIEIIIKESNQSLPAPPPPPPPKKKKKEPVQVFYVKYKKEPSHYGEEKVVYEPPIPAITPPTNNDHHEEEEEPEEYHHHEEPVTLPPRPSTTLKAIIRPDSETYHGSGIRITFGGPKDEESDHHHDEHSAGGYEEQSAPQPSVLLAPKPKLNIPLPAKPTPDSQLTKRNPTPFHSQTPPPAQQNYHSGSPFSTPNEFYRPTAGPAFHNTPRFSAQPHPFTPQLPKISPSLPPPSSPSAPARSPSNLRYTTLPHFPSFSKPQSSFVFPEPSQPSHPPSGTQQIFSINQPHLKSSFSISSRSTPQPYQTISNRVTQQPFPKAQAVPSNPIPPFQSLSKPFSQPPRPFPKLSHSFSQPPNSFSQPGPSFSQSSFPHGQKGPVPDPRNQNPSVLPPQRHHSQLHQHQHQQHVQQQQQQQQYNLDQFKQQQHHQQLEQFSQQQRQQQVDHQRLQQFEQQRQHQIEQQRQKQFEHQRQQQLEQLKQQQHQQQHLQQIERLNQLQRQQQEKEQFQRQQYEQQLRSQQISEQLRQQQQQQQQQQQYRSQVQSTQTFQKQSFGAQPSTDSTYAPEIIKSISAEFPFESSHRFDAKTLLQSTSKPQQHVQQNLPPSTRGHFIQKEEPTSRPQYVQNTQPPPRQQYAQTLPSTSKPNYVQNVQSNTQRYTVSKTSTTQPHKTYTEPTPPPIEYITQDPEEERRKKEERKKQNVAALPDEVPEDLRKQLLSSDILGNADIQILDYDKIGDIPIDKLPPEALANFQAIAGSAPVPAVTKPDSSSEDVVAEGSEQHGVVVPPPSDVMEMKVVRYNPDSQEGAQLASQYMKEGATQLEPVVLNDSRYNRYLPLKVSGAQFPVPDVPELRGKNVTSVVVLAPVDYEFLQRQDSADDGRTGRSSHPVLEVQGVHFVTGDILKTLVKRPTLDNYRLWLEKENNTPVDKQSVVLLVIDSMNNGTQGSPKEIYMYEIGTQKVNKLSGELSAQFVEVAESNSENDDLEEISDSQRGSFTVKEASGVSSERKQRDTDTEEKGIDSSKSAVRLSQTR